MHLFNLEQIQKSLNITRDFEELINSQKYAFIDFSSNLYEAPIPMQFIIPAFASDCHIKSGYRKGNQDLVIKIAGSSKCGNNGAILVFDVTTWKIKAILEDKGYLTTLRTAITGMIMLDIIPWEPRHIGIIGSGSLAQQLYRLSRLKSPNADVTFYARNKSKISNMSNLVCYSAEDLITKCDVVFTATSSLEPIIHAIPQNKNTLIIALGSDDEHKSEISSNLFGNADMVIVDSKQQALKFGDIARALKTGIIEENTVIELGSVIKSGIPKNIKTIIADFSGIGFQDVAVTEFVLSKI